VATVACGLLLAATISALADDHGDSGKYVEVNLVSDQSGVAQIQDTNLVNAWGMSFSGGSPFWISDNGTGKSTLYSVTNNSSGAEFVTQLGLVVTIPGEGNVTGQFFNGTPGFNGDVFVFVSEDGTISGWRGALGTTAEVLTNRAGASYKGVTLATNSSGPVLLAANFAEGTVDVYDTNTALIAQYSDPRAPHGYAPFNVQNIHGFIFVTFAKQDPSTGDDVAGRGHGLIDVLNADTGRFHRFASGSDAGGRFKEINSPWGVALAPRSFGEHGGDLLVGNFGNGTIMAFNAEGDFRGLLQGERHGTLVIDGLWALAFGNGTSAGSADTLFFTAGPDDEGHGLFGSLEPLRKHNHNGHGHDGD
jgi:uncharacterized protein (TIGR03118 family)